MASRARKAAWPNHVSCVFVAPATWGGTEDDAFWAAATSGVQESRTVRTRARWRFTVRFLQERVNGSRPA